jgi:hypothetical protein
LPGDSLPRNERPLETFPEDLYAKANASPATTAGNFETVSLEREADRERLSVDDQIRLGDQSLRRWMVIGFVLTCIIGDLLTLGAIAWFASLDQANIEHNLIKPAERIVTAQVIMSLLGATTVQVGAIAVIIARYLFPGRSRGG